MENREKIRNCRAKYFSPNICFNKLSTLDVMTVSDSDTITDTWVDISTKQSFIPLLD